MMCEWRGKWGLSQEVTLQFIISLQNLYACKINYYVRAWVLCFLYSIVGPIFMTKWRITWGWCRHCSGGKHDSKFILKTFLVVKINSPNFAGIISGSFSSPGPSLTPEVSRSLPLGVEWSKDVLLGPECFSTCGWRLSWSPLDRDRRNLTTTRSTTEIKVRAAPTTMPRMGEIGSSPSDAVTE